MINEEQVTAIASLKRITLQNAEKEYFQEMMLYSIYSLVGKELLFKGGTCLYKIYKLNRFSEDLDFDISKSLDVEKLVKKALYGIKLLGINCSVKYLDEYENAVNVGINFHGPLYHGTKESLCFLLINFSLRKKPVLPPRLEKLSSIYKDFPDFDVFVMDLQEILAEKIAAIHNRNKPRDVYDVWFLLKNLSVEPNKNLIKRKLKKEFDKSDFILKVSEKEGYWTGELSMLFIGQIPSFIEIKKDIERLI
ncbi:nucleotidyl transferase AbiEii/AbiGii toxin family protein [Candidatus Micrarchaeota archaeon]|nr:nucleotidyl transferase AbiEii/AbiGii toxin family protein [Candidatus Micrarchaeota archaeon]